MEKKHIAVGLAPVLCTLGVANAAFIYDNAIQGSSGTVLASGGGFDQDGYGLNAPDPLASWSTGDINIDAVAPNGNNAGLHTSYDSVLSSNLLSFRGRIFDAHATVGPSGTAEFGYQQTFSVAFHVDAPMQVTLAASLLRQTVSGSPPFTPMSMTFGRKDSSAIIEFAYPGDEANYSESFPATLVNLLPGDYTLSIFTNNFFDSGSAAYHEELNFQLGVPTPGTAIAGLPLAMLGLRRRRSS